MPPVLSPRSNFGISVMHDCLFVAGGYNGFTTTPNVEYYNVKTGAWSDAWDMEISRGALSCCVVYGLNNMAEYAAPRYSLELPSEESLHHTMNFIIVQNKLLMVFDWVEVLDGVTKAWSFC